jgi:hypothetical protein
MPRVEDLGGDERVRLATRRLLAKAQAARENPYAFLQFVFRSQETNEPFQPAPHQELFFSFVRAHRYSVVRQPVGSSKTVNSVALALWLLGRDATERGGFVSAAESQAKKLLAMAADYITEPALRERLRLVFPALRQSTRTRDAWTQIALTVDRPPGIRDPSIRAYGMGGAMLGSRWEWVVCDDILDAENTLTPDKRTKVHEFLVTSVLSRLDFKTGRCTVTNTPWDRDDITFRLEATGEWAVLSMDVYGYVKLTGKIDPGWWETEGRRLLRPSVVREGEYRLRAFDPDPEEETTLWPLKWGCRAEVEAIERRTLPHVFAQQFLVMPDMPGAERCSPLWIQRCKDRGVGRALVREYKGPMHTYTGADFGLGKTKRSNVTTLFTIGVDPRDKSRVLLWIESGKWTGPQVLDKLVDHSRRYGSIIVVESNAAQKWMKQFIREHHKDVKVRPHMTGREKYDVEWGVESVFQELRDGAWVIPCDYDGEVEPEVQEWINDCIYYRPPPAHTGDRLMASWIVREGSRKRGTRDPKSKLGAKSVAAPGGGGGF